MVSVRGLMKTLTAAVQAELGGRLISRQSLTIRKLNLQQHEKSNRSPSLPRDFAVDVEGKFCFLNNKINKDSI